MAGTMAPPYGREIMWARIAELVDRAPSLDVLRAHRLQFLAASLWREQGSMNPRSSLTRSASPRRRRLRRRCCSAGQRRPTTGGFMLMKGLEVAVRYPDPASRSFTDLDLLAEEPDAAQHALIGAGFVELQTGRDYSGEQHLAPLAWPGFLSS